MEITICGATRLELAPLQYMTGTLEATGHRFRYLTTGVGMLQSCFYLQQHIQRYRPQLLLQIGIAGCFDPEISPGEVVLVEKEYLGSAGVEENNKSSEGWQDIFDLGLQKPSDTPFKDKALSNPFLDNWPWLQQIQIRSGAAVTIDEITTSRARIRSIQEHYHPVTESMEGAALHFNGLMHQIPFLQARGISNLIGERDKSKWQIQAALKAVSDFALQFLRQI